MKYIIRADYYSDGSIMPIGITDEFGNSHIIKNVGTRINVNTGKKEFNCIIGEKKIILTFAEQKWEIKYI